MGITKEQFVKLFPKAPSPDTLVVYLNEAMDKYQINTKQRIAAYLAQCGHENGGYTTRVENLNYKVEALLNKFSRVRISEADARKYGRIDGKQSANQQAIANAIYGGAWGKANLGNLVYGDGWKYRGRGDIQTTGLYNYTECGKALGVDLINHPELLEQPKYAALSAAWFFTKNGLLPYADKNDIANVSSIVNTGKPNRVALGADERKALYETVLRLVA